MDAEFNGKIVVVSGGSRGIGRAIAVAFGREGAQTVLAATSRSHLADAAKTVVGAGGTAPLMVDGDLSHIEGCENVFARVNERFGRCDILVNNAGATRGGNFLDLPDEAWVDGFALKFLGAVRLTRLFWPMLKAAEGHVINIVGGAARTPDADFLIGGAVNAAVANFSKGMARLGNREGVNVNVIHPGLTETDRVEQLFQQFAQAQGKTPAEIRATSIAKSGARRIGQSEDIAELAVFLCRKAARHIQGTAIAVDGGSTPGFY